MAEAASSSSEFKPHLFGKFYLLQRLAVGGMAEIFRARVPGAGGFEKELVVKRILPARAQDEGFIKMLVNEAKLTVQLTHSNIAQVYECGRIDGNYFISMELVNGVSMKEMMQLFSRAGQVISPEQAIYIVLQLLTGLDYAHRKTDGQGRPLEIVHCDVSPDNALISWEGEIKLLDFGIARAATGLSNYKEGMLMGKLGYVAPEQASVDHGWDHRVDLFAAGIILYELLTKQKPFPRATDVDSLVSSRKAKVVPPTAIEPRLPKDLDAILARALAYDPAKRFSDARSFADALVDALFPTAISSIQDLLGTQMKAVFAEKIARQRAARAHDPLIMKVLANVAERQAQAEYERLSTPAATPLPAGLNAGGSPDSMFEPHVAPMPSELPTTEPARPTSRRSSRPRTVVREGVRVTTAILVGLVLAVVGAAGLHLGEIWYRPGLLVVTSEPAGAEVTLDGKKVGLTPVVIEEVWLSRPHELTLEAARTKPSTLIIEPEPGKAYRRVHARLENAMGTLRVESEPLGAEVRLDDRPHGHDPADGAGREDGRAPPHRSHAGGLRGGPVRRAAGEGREPGGAPARQDPRQERGATGQLERPMKLVIEDEAGTRTVVPFTGGEITVGRAAEGGGLRLPDRDVSRRHARFLHVNGVIFVEDLGSLTGTRVNGDRITGRRRLREGDLIEIGGYDLAIVPDEGLAAVAGPGAPPPLPGPRPASGRGAASGPTAPALARRLGPRGSRRARACAAAAGVVRGGLPGSATGGRGGGVRGGVGNALNRPPYPLSRSPDHQQHVPLADGLPLAAEHLADRARRLGLERHLHLHRLEHHQDLTWLDHVARRASGSSRSCR